jgi:hypothetical protein
MAKSFRSNDVPAPEPVFPRFKPLTLADRAIFRKILWDYQAETSELTFTNLLMWQSLYGYQWSLDRDRLLVVSLVADRPAWALPPVGPPPRVDLCRRVLGWLRDECGVADPAIERADPRLAAEVASHPEFVVEPVRDHFDYVYRTEDLIRLPGGPYHAKRNHINSLARAGGYRYEPLGPEHLAACLELSGKWCDIKRCDLDMSLMGEWAAIGVALDNFQALHLKGGVILVNDRVEAFTCGELLNEATAVIHLEKANPEIRGLYAVINQQFCQQAWAGVPFVNREQDLGEPGLRTAKLSYHPLHLVEKFRIRLASGAGGG